MSPVDRASGPARHSPQYHPDQSRPKGGGQCYRTATRGCVLRPTAKLAAQMRSTEMVTLGHSASFLLLGRAAGAGPVQVGQARTSIREVMQRQSCFAKREALMNGRCAAMQNCLRHASGQERNRSAEKHDQPKAWRKDQPMFETGSSLNGFASVSRGR